MTLCSKDCQPKLAIELNTVLKMKATRSFLIRKYFYTAICEQVCLNEALIFGVIVCCKHSRHVSFMISLSCALRRFDQDSIRFDSNGLTSNLLRNCPLSPFKLQSQEELRCDAIRRTKHSIQMYISSPEKRAKIIKSRRPGARFSKVPKTFLAEIAHRLF